MIHDYPSQIIAKTQHTHDILTLTFRITNNEPLVFEAGQYLIMHVPQEGKPAARRLFSIVTPAENTKEFELLIELVPNGLASEYVKNSQVGEELFFQGPAGLFTLRNNNHDKVFLVTGTGIAPVFSMMDHHLPLNLDIPIKLLWGMPKAEDLYLVERLQSIQKQYPNFSFQICLSREEDLAVVSEQYRQHCVKGRVTAGFETLFSGENAAFLAQTEFYLCGGRDVVESLRQFVMDKGVPKERIILEKF